MKSSPVKMKQNGHIRGGGSAGGGLAAKVRMYSVVMSIGAGSMFLVALDSIVDNLLPVAQTYLIGVFGSRERADLAWEWIVSSRIYGLAFGCFAALLLSNCAMRRRPLIWALVLNLLGGLLSAMIVYSGQVGVMIACGGRFLSGVGSGIAQVVGSAMLAELPPSHSRGTVLATLLGTHDHWHLALAAPTLLIPFALLCIVSAPDSPRALMLAGKRQEALLSIQFYQSPEDWPKSLEEIRSECCQEADLLLPSTKEPHHPIHHDDSWASWLRLRELLNSIRRRLRSGTFVRPLLLGGFVLTLAHLNDWLWISYSTQVFENVGMAPAGAMRASLFMSVPQALISIALLFCFDGFSRRLLLIAPTLASICLSSVAVLSLGQSKGREEDTFYGLVPIHRLIVLLATLDLSAAAVASESAYTVVPELFSQRDRVLGSALIGIVQNAFGAFLTTISLSIINSFGTQFVLLPFMALNFLYILIIYEYLPETNGCSLHAISLQFREEMPHFPYHLPSIFNIRHIRPLRHLEKLFAQLLVPFGEAKTKGGGGGGGGKRVAGRWARIATNVTVLAAQLLLCVFFMHLLLRFLGFILLGGGSG